MERKDLKIYEAPVSGVVELKVQTALLSGSSGVEGVEDATDITGGNDNPGF